MKFLITLLMLILSVNVYADEETSWGKVTEVWSGYGNGMILFKLDIPHENPKSCSATTFYSVSAEKSDTSKFISILLTAKSSNSPVKLMLSTADCFSGYPMALRIGLR